MRRVRLVLVVAALAAAVAAPAVGAVPGLVLKCGGTPPPPPPPEPATDIPDGTREPSEPPPATTGGGTTTGPTTEPSAPPGGDVGGPTTPDGGKGPDPGTTPRGGGASEGPGGPTTSGGAPGASPGGPTTGRDRGNLILDRDDWKYWWTTNRTELLDLHARMLAAAARTAEEGGAARGEEIWRAEAQRALAAAVTDPDRDVAGAALVALGRSGDVGETPTLTRVLADRERDLVLRTSAALGLGLMPVQPGVHADAARDALLAVARDRSERDGLRASATYALGSRGEERSVPGLFALGRTGGHVWDVPAAALSSMGMTKCEAVRAELERLLAPPKRGRDREWMRRVYAAHGLARLGDRASLPLLLETVDDEHPDVRRAAIMALGSLAVPTDDAVRARLLRALDGDRDGPCRNMAALALGRLGGTGVTKALRRTYDDGDQIHRCYSALALGFAARREDDDSVRRFLARELADRSMLELRGALAIACGVARSTHAVPELRRIASSNGDPALRGHSAMALGLIGDAASGPFLTELLRARTDEDVTSETALALGILGERSAVDTLSELVEKGSGHHVQAAAAVALGRIGGPKAAATFARLVTSRTVDNEVREAAAIGLGLLLDLRDGHSYVAVAADLDWYATTATVREILDLH